MTSRREGLVVRYKARALDLIRKLLGSIEQLERGQGTEELRKQIARGLHTLKGDSTVMGYERVSELAHHAEEQLLASSGEEPVSPAACREVRCALDAVEQLLGGASADAPVTALLAAALQRLTSREAARADPAAGGAPAGAAAGGEGTQPRSPAAAAPEVVAPGRWMQVRTSRVDDLTEGISELSSELLALAHRSATSNARSVQEDLARCAAMLERLVESAWALRLVSVEPALQALVEHGEQLARSLGKQVHVSVRAEGVELERTVVEELSEPLTHLVRNAVDHGIEAPEDRGAKPRVGQVIIQARATGSQVTIAVADDGRGVDAEEVRRAALGREIVTRAVAEELSEQEIYDLLFTHGFSTRPSVSSTSGRGVGLDVVRSRVEALGGRVAVSSQPGLGTRFELVVPATVTREKCLVVGAGQALYALPASQVLEVLRTRRAAPVEVSGGSSIRFRERSIPVHSLGAALGYAPEEEGWLVIIEQGNRHHAFGVTELIGDRELIRRPLDPVLRRGTHLAASSVLEDGRVVLVMSAAGLLRRAEAVGGARPAVAPRAKARETRVLIVDDSPIIRGLLTDILTGAQFSVEEATNGQAALSLLERGPPDIVLTDVEMPQMDGFELLRQIRSRWQQLPVVMLSTRAGADDRRRAVATGANAYLIKSEFKETTLLAMVRRLVGARS